MNEMIIDSKNGSVIGDKVCEFKNIKILIHNSSGLRGADIIVFKDRDGAECALKSYRGKFFSMIRDVKRL